jgi:hypothetical protein
MATRHNYLSVRCVPFSASHLKLLGVRFRFLERGGTAHIDAALTGPVVSQLVIEMLSVIIIVLPLPLIFFF